MIYRLNESLDVSRKYALHQMFTSFDVTGNVKKAVPQKMNGCFSSRGQGSEVWGLAMSSYEFFICFSKYLLVLKKEHTEIRIPHVS